MLHVVVFLCVCACVFMCACVSCGFEEGGEAKWDPAALWHLTCRKWEVGEWKGGNNMKQLPALWCSGAPVMKPGIFYWWDTFSAKQQHVLSPGTCMVSGEFYGRRRGRGKERGRGRGRGWLRPMKCQQKRHSDPSVIGPFIRPSICLLIPFILNHSHVSFFPLSQFHSTPASWGFHTNRCSNWEWLTDSWVSSHEVTSASWSWRWNCPPSPPPNKLANKQTN